MDYLSFVLYLLLAWIAIHLVLSNAKKSSDSHPRTLPPGPPTVPIFGNLFSLGTKPHVSLTELSKRYGPLMTLQLGQVPTVIISSADMAKEALQRNDISFSNRMVIDAVCALNHHENSIVWSPVSTKWRNFRKICNSHVFSNNKLVASQSFRVNQVKDLLSYVQKCSETNTTVDIGQAAFTTILNLLSSTFFSVNLGDLSSEFTHEFKQTVRCIMDEAGKPNFADYFPILKKIDPQGIRRRMSVHFQKMIDLFNSMIEQRLQGQISSDTTQSYNFLDALLGISQEKTEEIDPSKIPNLFVDLFAAGTDTTSSTIEWAMAELLKNPEKLKKTQQELHQTVGKENPVKESDITHLPYLQAIVKETLRLHPAVPFLVPRKVESDIKLFGFTVPKNAQVLVNVWAIGRDPDVWERPESFEPERFVGSEIDVKGCDFELIPFGAGRRICPGLPLAIRIIPLILGSLIHGFDWKLEDEVSSEKMDMEENFAFTLEKNQRLRVIPVPV
ncbi:geraniol 8-hydroxylase-like [Chenopodium quinoa]|uniref:geraniol 8-hydroxylase-like n=1 Tax=Chenopodium quinoa TaxID=63459 RepID=UPI000B76EC2C|nr:geraniol 8-hydroxylase-like [Chenopodium quinoa]